MNICKNKREISGYKRGKRKDFNLNSHRQISTVSPAPPLNDTLAI